MKTFFSHHFDHPVDQLASMAEILLATLQAVDPKQAVKAALSVQRDQLLYSGGQVDLRAIEQCYLVGFGKASVTMGQGVAELLGSQISSARIIAKHAAHLKLPFIEDSRVLISTHPVPTQKSVDGAMAIARLVEGAGDHDLVICVISGGGSSLFTWPVEGISLNDMQQLTRQLLAGGATINEMNILRKHLDRVKGGGLAKMVYPAPLLTLVLSDVVVNPLDVIASGPTVADGSTYADCLAILKKYNLEESVPASILNLLKRGQSGLVEETVKAGSQYLERTTNLLVGSNEVAAEAGHAAAVSLGFDCEILGNDFIGEAHVVGKNLGKRLIVESSRRKRPFCLIAGGETTVTLTGSGHGGRNQEVAAGAATVITGQPNLVVVTLATDGEDGPTDAAGAIVTGETLSNARQLGLDIQSSLANNDLYPFFAKLNALLKPGPTGTNVNDLTFLFAF